MNRLTMLMLVLSTTPSLMHAVYVLYSFDRGGMSMYAFDACFRCVLSVGCIAAVAANVGLLLLLSPSQRELALSITLLLSMSASCDSSASFFSACLQCSLRPDRLFSLPSWRDERLQPTLRLGWYIWKFE